MSNFLYRYYKVFVSVIGLLICTFSTQWAFSQAQFMDGMRRGVVRVKFKEGHQPAYFSNARTSGEAIQTGVAAFDQINVQFGATQVKRVFEAKGGNEAKLRKHGLHLWYEVIGDPTQDIATMITHFEQLAEIERAEANYEKQFDQGKMIAADLNAMRSRNNESMPMDDPSLVDQWHYHNTGEWHDQAVAGADINLFEAWERHQVYGDSRVIVSVHDEGIDIEHEDLKANLWVNSGESNTGMEVGKDTDGNGYIDDIHGFNFGENSPEITPDPHGTHVAGTVAAVNNNGVGVSGVAGGSGNGDGARVMVCQILSGGSTAERIAESYIYAADNGAVISQNSWGYTSPDFKEEVIHDAIKYFVAEAGDYEGSPMKGGLVFFAPGNSNVNFRFYPGAYDEVVAVGAMAPDFTKASYSNFGEYFDVFAPGGDGYGITEVLSLAPSDGYAYFAGTSMACPHVSGIAALVLSHPENFGKLDSEGLRNIILTSVRDIYQYNASGYAGQLGRGYIDTEYALRIDDGNGPENITDFIAVGSSFDMVSYQWSVPSDVVDIYPEEYHFTWATDAQFSNAETVTIKNNNQQAGTKMQFDLKKLDDLPFGTPIFAKIKAIDRWGNTNEESVTVASEIKRSPELTVEFHDSNADGHHLITADFLNPSTPWLKVKNMASASEGGALKWQLVSGTLELNAMAEKAAEMAEVPASFNAPRARSAAGVSVTLTNQLLERSDLNVAISAAANNVSDPNYIGAIDPKNTTDPYLHLMGDPYETLYTSIGDGSRYLTNSQAQRFTVPATESGQYTIDYVTFRASSRPDFYGTESVEIYLGSSLETAKRVAAFNAQEFNPSGTTSDYDAPLTMTRRAYLPNKLIFEEGENFWVVVHHPAGKFNASPMFIGTWAGVQHDKTSMMSFDGGKNWQDLNEALESDLPQFYGSVFDVMVMPYVYQSQKILQPTVTEGILEAGEQVQIPIQLHLDSVKAGEHELTHTFLTNEKDQTYHNFLVDFNLINVQPQLEVDEVTDFGRIFEGGTTTHDLYISNIGYADAKDLQWEISDDAFTVTGPSDLPARYRNKFAFTFKPTEQREYNATAIASMEGTDRKLRLVLTGSGIAPSVLKLSPAEIVLPDTDLNDPKHIGNTFKIMNDGNAALQYVIAKYSDKDIPDYERSNLFGYTYKTDFKNSNLSHDPAEDAPEFRDISNHVSTQDITEEIRVSSQLNKRIDIGFAFPFFGEYYGHIYLSKYGILCFSDHAFNATPSFRDTYMPEGYISGLFENLSFNDGGRLLYLQEQGKLTVQYDQVKTANASTYNKAFSFQYVIYSSGDIDIVYDSSWPAEGTDGYILRTFAYVAIEEPQQEDGLLFKKWNHFPELGYGTIDPEDTEALDKTALGYYLQFRNPGVNLAENFNTTHGTLLAGEEEVITFDIDPSQWFEGEFEQYIAVVSNDPVNTSQGVHVKMNIVSGGTPGVETIVEDIHFDAVLNQQLESKYIPVNNTGTSAFRIDGVEFSNPGFVLKNQSILGATVAPKETAYLEIVADTENVGDYSADMQVALSGIDPLHFNLTAKVTEVPIFSWQWENDQTTVDLHRGDLHYEPFTVKNEGRSDLTFFFDTDSWFNVLKTGSSSEVSEVDYKFETGKQECWWEQSGGFDLIEVCGRRGPSYDWVELADHPQAEYMPELNFWTGQPFANKQLPFSFEFYGKHYEQINIASFGFVTFNEVENREWDNPGMIPYIPYDKSRFQTMIAPLYHPTSPNFYEFPKTAGVYYLEEEDQVTIQYHLYNDMFGMGYSMSFQLILYATGNFKFQYQMPDRGFDASNTIYFLDAFGSIGIQSEDKMQGYQLSFMENYISDEMSIVFKPQQKFVLGPMETGTYELLIDSREIGTYEVEGVLHALSNQPGTEEDFKHPIHVNIEGVGAFTPEESTVDLGIIFYESLDPLIQEGIDHRVRITNTGTAPIEIVGGGLERNSARQVFGEKIYDGGSLYIFTPISDYVFTTPKQIAPGDFFDFYVEISPEYAQRVDGQYYLVSDEFINLATNLNFTWRALDAVGSEQQVSIPWKAALGSAPVYGGHDEIIRSEIVRGERKSYSISLSNEKGKSPLQYKAAVEYYRQETPFARLMQDENVETTEGLPFATLFAEVDQSARAVQMEEEAEVGDIPSDKGLVHFFENIRGNNAFSVTGFGQGVPFSAATKFQAPEEGSRLSKVWTLCQIEKTEIVEIKVAVYRGTTIETMQLVHEQTAIKTYDGEENTPHWFGIELEEEIEILPYENFYVQFTYPRSIALPQAFDRRSNREYGKDYIISQGLWFDSNYVGLGGAGWQIKVGAEHEGQGGWLIFPGGPEGEIDIESKGTIDFRIDATKEVDDYLAAEITFRTNDPVWKRPYHTEVMVDVLNPLNTEEEQQFGVAPNPATDFVNVSFRIEAAATATIDIFSTTGQLLLSQQTQAISGNNQIKVPVSGLSSGLYMLRISTDQAVIGQANIIKQ
ncbi:S8 family serine peptidase [Persicobacter psychrovividus]|uniref:S8 family serine peptidase n=1 Tax=Persicobacter psychrovividus TaxID=387638 RepID=A0ABM7VLI4_9BACT|nr:hypothetical protein PEPS_41240 [Persicobacter psychrovividus]